MRCAVRAAARGAAHVGGGPLRWWWWWRRLLRGHGARGFTGGGWRRGNLILISGAGGRGQVEVAKRIRLEASAVNDFPVSFEFTLDIPGSQNRILAGF